MADVLCEQVIPLLRYLDGKLEKYAESSDEGSYVELVHNMTRTKVVSSIETAKQIESLTAECATAKASLQEKEN